MKLMQEPVELSLVYGTTWLSPGEVTRLEPGDLLRTPQLCGNPHALRVNGRWLGLAEVVVLGANFGARLVSLASEPAGTDRPPVDRALDLVAAELVFSTRAYAFGDLKDLAPGALIEFDTPFSKDEDTRLVVAGHTVAFGKAIILGEAFGLRVTRVLVDGDESLPVRISFNRHGADMPGPDKLKAYDWKRPDKFSRRQIERLARLHEHFLERALFFGAAWQGCRLVSVDQCTFQEAMADWKDPAHFAVLRLESSSKRTGAVPRTGLPPLLMLKDSPNRAQLESWFKPGPDAPPRPRVEWNSVVIAHRPASPLAALFDAAAPDRILAPLGDVWKNLTPSTVAFDRMADLSADAQVVPPNDMVVTITLAKGEERVCLIYPYITLESFLRYLD